MHNDDPLRQRGPHTLLSSTRWRKPHAKLTAAFFGRWPVRWAEMQVSLRDFIEFMCRTEELSRGVSRGLVPGVPAHGAVTVEVLNCQGLLPADTNFLGTASSDPYVVLPIASPSQGPGRKAKPRRQRCPSASAASSPLATIKRL